MLFMEKTIRILPDTQIFIWSVGETKRFSKDAAALLKNEFGAEIFFCRLCLGNCYQIEQWQTCPTGIARKICSES